MKFPFAGRLAAPVAVLSAVIVLAGCGGDSDDEGGANGGVTSVTVTDVAGIPSSFLNAGVSKGFFKRHGLDVEVRIAAGGAAIIPAVISGDSEFGGSNLVSVLIGATEGLPIKIVAAGTFGPEDKSADWAGILVNSDSEIRTPEDLEGKTIAVNTLENVATETANASLKNLGVDTSSIEYTEIDFPDMLAALDQGRVDAVFEIEPFVTAGLAAGDRRIVSPYYSTKPGLQIGSYVAREDYVEQNPDVVSDFQAGLADTAQFVSTQPDQFRRVLASEDVTGADELTLPTWRASVDLASMRTHASLMTEQGLIEEQPPLRDLVDPGALGE